MLGQFQNNLVQHFGQEAQKQSKDLAQQAEKLLQSNPDKALVLARKSLAAAERGLAKAADKTAAWTKQRDVAQESVTVLRLALDSFINNAGTVDSADEYTASAVQQLKEANTALRREDFAAAKKAALEGQQQVRKAEQIRQQQQEQEEVRREVVRGLRQVLGKMNFKVERPHFGQDNESGNVILKGTLPSGKSARFVISQDGMTGFDFNGYEGRICKKDLRKIQSEFEKLCQAETKDLEIHWKDEEPIRIDIITLDLPNNQQNSLR